MPSSHSSGRQHAQDSRIENSEVKQMFYNLIQMLGKLYSLFSAPELVKLLTYDEAIAYFIDHHPVDERVVKGGLCILKGCPPRRNSMLTGWFFLDDQNQVCKDAKGQPYGRHLRVVAFDKELEDCFDGKSMLIFE